VHCHHYLICHCEEGALPDKAISRTIIEIALGNKRPRMTS